LNDIRALGEDVLQLSEDLEPEGVNKKVRGKCNYCPDDGQDPDALGGPLGLTFSPVAQKISGEPNKKTLYQHTYDHRVVM